MSWNIGKTSKLIAARRLSGTIEVSTHVTKSMLFKNRTALPIETLMKEIMQVLREKKDLVSFRETKLMAHFGKIGSSEFLKGHKITSQFKSPAQVKIVRWRPSWNKSSLQLRRSMLLNIEMNHNR